MLHFSFAAKCSSAIKTNQGIKVTVIIIPQNEKFEQYLTSVSRDPALTQLHLRDDLQRLIHLSEQIVIAHDF